MVQLRSHIAHLLVANILYCYAGQSIEHLVESVPTQFKGFVLSMFNSWKDFIVPKSIHPSQQSI